MPTKDDISNLEKRFFKIIIAQYKQNVALSDFYYKIMISLHYGVIAWGVCEPMHWLVGMSMQQELKLAKILLVFWATMITLYVMLYAYLIQIHGNVTFIEKSSHLIQIGSIVSLGIKKFGFPLAIWSFARCAIDDQVHWATWILGVYVTILGSIIVVLVILLMFNPMPCKTFVACIDNSNEIFMYFGAVATLVLGTIGYNSENLSTKIWLSSVIQVAFFIQICYLIYHPKFWNQRANQLLLNNHFILSVLCMLNFAYESQTEIVFQIMLAVSAIPLCLRVSSNILRAACQVDCFDSSRPPHRRIAGIAWMEELFEKKRNNDLEKIEFEQYFYYRSILKRYLMSLNPVNYEEVLDELTNSSQHFNLFFISYIREHAKSREMTAIGLKFQLLETITCLNMFNQTLAKFRELSMSTLKGRMEYFYIKTLYEARLEIYYKVKYSTCFKTDSSLKTIFGNLILQSSQAVGPNYLDIKVPLEHKSTALNLLSSIKECIEQRFKLFHYMNNQGASKKLLKSHLLYEMNRRIKIITEQIEAQINLLIASHQLMPKYIFPLFYLFYISLKHNSSRGLKILSIYKRSCFMWATIQNKTETSSIEHGVDLNSVVLYTAVQKSDNGVIKNATPNAESVFGAPSDGQIIGHNINEFFVDFIQQRHKQLMRGFDGFERLINVTREFFIQNFAGELIEIHFHLKVEPSVSHGVSAVAALAPIVKAHSFLVLLQPNLDIVHAENAFWNMFAEERNIGYLENMDQISFKFSYMVDLLRVVESVCTPALLATLSHAQCSESSSNPWSLLLKYLKYIQDLNEFDRIAYHTDASSLYYTRLSGIPLYCKVRFYKFKDIDFIKLYVNFGHKELNLHNESKLMSLASDLDDHSQVGAFTKIYSRVMSQEDLNIEKISKRDAREQSEFRDSDHLIKELEVVLNAVSQYSQFDGVESELQSAYLRLEHLVKNYRSEMKKQEEYILIEQKCSKSSNCSVPLRKATIENCVTPIMKKLPNSNITSSLTETNANIGKSITVSRTNDYFEIIPEANREESEYCPSKKGLMDSTKNPESQKLIINNLPTPSQDHDIKSPGIRRKQIANYTSDYSIKNRGTPSTPMRPRGFRAMNRFESKYDRRVANVNKHKKEIDQMDDIHLEVSTITMGVNTTLRLERKIRMALEAPVSSYLRQSLCSLGVAYLLFLYFCFVFFSVSLSNFSDLCQELYVIGETLTTVRLHMVEVSGAYTLISNYETANTAGLWKQEYAHVIQKYYDGQTTRTSLKNKYSKELSHMISYYEQFKKERDYNKADTKSLEKKLFNRDMHYKGLQFTKAQGIDLLASKAIAFNSLYQHNNDQKLDLQAMEVGLDIEQIILDGTFDTILNGLRQTELEFASVYIPQILSHFQSILRTFMLCIIAFTLAVLAVLIYMKHIIQSWLISFLSVYGTLNMEHISWELNLLEMSKNILQQKIYEDYSRMQSCLNLQKVIHSDSAMQIQKIAPAKSSHSKSVYSNKNTQPRYVSTRRQLNLQSSRLFSSVKWVLAISVFLTLVAGMTVLLINIGVSFLTSYNTFQRIEYVSRTKLVEISSKFNAIRMILPFGANSAERTIRKLKEKVKDDSFDMLVDEYVSFWSNQRSAYQDINEDDSVMGIRFKNFCYELNRKKTQLNRISGWITLCNDKSNSNLMNHGIINFLISQKIPIHDILISYEHALNLLPDDKVFSIHNLTSTQFDSWYNLNFVKASYENMLVTQLVLELSKISSDNHNSELKRSYKSLIRFLGAMGGATLLVFGLLYLTLRKLKYEKKVSAYTFQILSPEILLKHGPAMVKLKSHYKLVG